MRSNQSSRGSPFRLSIAHEPRHRVQTADESAMNSAILLSTSLPLRWRQVDGFRSIDWQATLVLLHLPAYSDGQAE